MRAALAVTLALAGCMQTEPPPGDYGSGGGPIGGIMCNVDTDCGSGQVCARTGECLAPSEVRTVHVTWTIGGAPANATTCASSPDLELDLPASDGSWWGWAPVPCNEGKFTVDKLPTWFTEADLQVQGDPSSAVSGTIDATSATAALDLSY